MHKIDLQLFYVGGINIAYDKRFQAPSSSIPKKPVKDDDKYRRMGGGSDVRGISPTERSYRAQQRANTIKPPTMPSFNFSGIGGIGPFKASQAYTDAMNYTNSLLQQLNGGRTAYSDKVDELMNTISNRDKFSYDFNTDPLFQNALASAMKSGATAMQDTIGQASALTGGYGSSYATSAANQAYNSYIQDAYAQLPEYYGLALNAYNQEGQELYNQLGMYQTADSTAYGRLADAYSMNLANAQNMYNQEYSNYWDTANYNLSAAKYNADQKYKYDMAKYEKEMDAYDKYLSQFAAYGGGKNAGGSSSGKSTGTEKGLSEPTETQYKKALDAFATGDYEKYRDSIGSGVDKDMLDQYVEQYGQEGAKYAVPTETQYKKALEAYNGGKSSYQAYIDSLPEDIDIDAIDNYVSQYGTAAWGKTFGVTKDTRNGGGANTIDRNDRVRAYDSNGQFTGEEIKMINLYKQLIAEGYTKDEAKAFVMSITGNNR